jgi:PAS domain S-box-containing protein
MKKPIKFLYLAGLLALLLMGINLGVILLVRSQEMRTSLSDTISPIVDLLASLALFAAAKVSARRSKRLAMAWGAIALATFLYVIGDIIWLILEVGLKSQPFPSIADGFYLAYYPVSLAGVFLLLEKSASKSGRINQAIDIGIVMGAAILGFWNFLIGPIIISNAGQPLLEQMILTAYPVGDLVLFGALLLIIYNRSDKQNQTPIFFLFGSLLATIIADCIYSYQSLLGTYVSGGLLDLGWIVSTSLIGLAGVAQFVAIHSTNSPQKSSRELAWRGRLSSVSPYLPYLFLAGAYALLVEGGLTALPMSFLALSIGVGAITVLVLLRQFITLSENIKLNAQLQASMGSYQTQSAELEQTNLQLQTDIAERKKAEAAGQQSEALFRTLFELSPDAIVLIDPHDPGGAWPILDCNVAACLMNGYSRDEMVGHSIDMVNLNPYAPVARDEYMKRLRQEGVYRLTTQHRRKDGSIFFVDIATTLFSVGGRELIVGIDQDITAKKQAEEQLKQRLAELEAVNQISTALRAAQTLEEMLPLLLDTTLEVMHATRGAVWLYDPARNELQMKVIRGWDASPGGPAIAPEKPGEGVNGYAFATGQPYLASDLHLDARLPEAVRQWIPPGLGGAAIPIHAGQNVIGTFDVNVSLPRELTPDEIHLLTTLSEIAGNAIQRTTLHQQTERRLQQLTALSSIDRIISATFDLRLSLGLLIGHVAVQLGVDATDVLLLNPGSQILEYSVGRGFRTKAFERVQLRLGEGYAGKAALEREIVHIPNLAGRHDNPRLEKHLADEQFVSYYGVPLISKGQVLGVLEVFQRSPLEPDKEWLDFFNAMAGQAAIAIDSVMQFDNVQRSNNELSQAYDETIEGWSRALDLRDHETEGHTQRVMEMTVALAIEAGLGEAELLQVRWGSLLHDIGKMGIPDGILLKPGPLTDQEWGIMKKHPSFAYEMIAPIRYLHTALDIPYCHHERWDGTGYPRGLKGEQIPLAARIFAVVDVWDALTSDRPYRKAWPEEKVREHIQAGTGTHFDPQFVKAFLASKMFSR